MTFKRRSLSVFILCLAYLNTAQAGKGVLTALVLPALDTADIISAYLEDQKKDVSGCSLGGSGTTSESQAALKVLTSATLSPYVIEIGRDKKLLSWSEKDLIGQGAFAKVYRGNFDGRPVAIKMNSVLRAIAIAGQDLHAHHQRALPDAFELIKATCSNLLAEVDRPATKQFAPLASCVASAHSEQEFNISVVIVFPLADGSLEKLLPSEIDHKLLLKNLIEDLLHTFSHGYVHQDIRPPNVLLTNDPQLRYCLGDLGTAKKLDIVEGDAESQDRIRTNNSELLHLDVNSLVRTVLLAYFGTAMTKEATCLLLARLAELDHGLFQLLNLLENGNLDSRAPGPDGAIGVYFPNPEKRLKTALTLI